MRYCALAAFLTIAAAALHAQDCSEVRAAAEMARARSVRTLVLASSRAGGSYLAQLVFAYRSFQLNPGDRIAAGRLLGLIPATDIHQQTVMTLGDSLCAQEPVADMETLDQVGAGLAREFTRGVILVPKFLPSYVNYAIVAIDDPHSDYAIQMAKVCRRAPSAFGKAVEGLPEVKRRFFVEHVMNPKNCRPLAVPEAEE